jgi:hypothetical protein
MKKTNLFVLSCLGGVFLMAFAPPAFALGELILTIGGKNGWEQIGSRREVVEMERVRPLPVLALGSGEKPRDASLDMALYFDEGDRAYFSDSTGNYTLYTADQIHSVGVSRARFGGGAVFSLAGEDRSAQTEANARSFNISAQERGSENGPLLIEARRPDALFSAGRDTGDFSIEFWLYPNSMENGEEILFWTAANPSGTAQKPAGGADVQSIRSVTSKNRLEWDLRHFFISPARDASLNLRLTSSTPVIPKTWSHHLLRFDSEIGLLEYLVNGILEDIVYTTESGEESGEIFTPVVGERGSFVLGRRFNGMLDNFRIYNRYLENADLRRYPAEGGAVRSEVIDLGGQNSSVLRIDVSGGVFFADKKSERNKFERNGNFRFPDGAQIQFFVRSSAFQYTWSESAWQTFVPGKTLSGIKNRFIQVEAHLYPGGDRETTPYLEAIDVVYTRKGAPSPPTQLRAVAKDGAVELVWKAPGDESIKGYLVYYGKASGEYFSDDSLRGSSPIDAGKRSSFTIDNLQNGVLYYFAVSAYDNTGLENSGGFSREVSARPLRMIE